MTHLSRAEQERVQLARMEESQRRKDEFLAIMGHELRNPLAPMVTALELVKLRGGRNCEREFAVLDRQLRHMTHLIDDLLNLTRVLRGQVDLNPTVLEIGQILANALEVAMPLIESKRHRLKVDVAPDGLSVCVDAQRMAQVFGNLLNNAAKYTDPGGEIALSAIARDDQVEVTVADTGIGISPDLLPRIFDLFMQGEQGIERRLGGLGIGLAIAHRLVDAHQGAIFAESQGMGRGSRFTVRVPRANLAMRARPPEHELSEKGVPRRVLVVDDNEDAGEMLSVLLQQLGHETGVAFDGPHALKLAHEFQPDIVFLDIGLPGLSGFEVAKRIRSIPACTDIPIIAMTGYAHLSDREESLRAGFSAHLAKAIDLKLVEEAVSMAPRRTRRTAGACAE